MSKSNILSTKRVTQAGLIDAVADIVKNSGSDLELPNTNNEQKKIAKAYVDAVFASIKAFVEEGTSVSIKDFGVFNKRQRGQRSVINPNSGEEISIPPKVIMGFKTKVSFGE